MSEKVRVLFLCTQNSARSQMAEAFLRQVGGDRFEVHSAGLEPALIHPYTYQVMAEVGIDLMAQGHRSKSLIEEYLDKQVHLGYLITVCGNAEAKCPIYPWGGVREYWGFADPADFEGTPAVRLAKFREVRDLIAERVKVFVAQEGVEA
ncbi:MAG TPA: arsenate reductase ArsC [Anaerolineae bacterium]|nr:arsenate reductase ArsC [Anaerolineae bacterium]